MAREVPPVLVDYLHFVLSSQVLITSVLDASSAWLLTQCIRYALYEDGDTSRRRNTQVIFLSFLKPQNLWSELAKKQGLDLAALASSDDFSYIDGLLDSKGSGAAGGSVDMITADGTHNALRKAVASVRSGSHVRPTDGTPRGIILLIDGLDFILAADSNADALQLQRQLTEIRQEVDGMVITCAADSPLLHNSGATATALEKQHSTFASILAHQSSLLMQLRPLDSGATKDVTGVLRMSKGGAYENQDEATRSLEDAEWLYYVRGDGNLRVWSRGE